VAGQSKYQVLIRMNRDIKRAARRAAKAESLTLTQYIIRLIETDEERRQPKPAERETEVA
jgi:uncharacterized protein (DUF1778 family)